MMALKYHGGRDVRKIGIVLLIVAVATLSGCLQGELTAEQKILVGELKRQLETTEQEILSATAEDARLSGGLVKALIGARLEILKTNRALVGQRINAIEAGSPVETVTQVSSADPEAAKAIAAELEKAKANNVTAKAEAAIYGGLVGALKASVVATNEQTIAMLEQRFLAAKYGLVSPTLSLASKNQTVASGTDALIGKEEVEACAGTTNKSERSACYDALASRHGLGASSPPESAEGGWITSSKQDPLTDETISTAMLFSETGSSRRGDNPVLIVRCSGKTTEMYINWNDYLGSDAYTTFRIGQEKATTSNWTMSTDKKAAFYPGSPVGALKRIIESDTFAASVTPYNESPITAVFNSKGSPEALADIRKSCAW
jgi:type VI secretion system protein VasI